MNDLQKKLDELVVFKNLLVDVTNNFDLYKIQSINSKTKYAPKLQGIAKKHQQRLKENIANYIDELNEVNRLVTVINKKLKNKNNASISLSIDSVNILINKINADIVDATTELAKLIDLDNIRKLCNDPDYNQKFLDTHLANGAIIFTDTALEIIQTSIGARCDWHYPGLQINPISKEWVDCMVAADPLYLIHHAEVFIKDDILYLPTKTINNIICDYPPEYQNRLRVYDIINQDFSALPQEQFGCIVCCNFLNFFSLAIVEKYLSTFFNLLRSGGTMICTIRLLYSSTEIVKQDYFYFTSKLTIQKFIKRIGYNITSIIDLSSEECIFLIEAQKPGVLTTTKAHQVLGKIIEK